MDGETIDTAMKYISACSKLKPTTYVIANGEMQGIDFTTRPLAFITNDSVRSEPGN